MIPDYSDRPVTLGKLCRKFAGTRQTLMPFWRMHIGERERGLLILVWWLNRGRCGTQAPLASMKTVDATDRILMWAPQGTSMITPTELYLLLKSIEVQRVAIIVVALNFKQRLFKSVLIVITYIHEQHV